MNDDNELNDDFEKARCRLAKTIDSIEKATDLGEERLDEVMQWACEQWNCSVMELIDMIECEDPNLAGELAAEYEQEEGISEK
jgi:hypothetical protein